MDRIVAGLEGRAMTDGKVKSLVAYHEVGHALCATLTPGHDPVQKVTLIPRGQAKGLTWFRPNEDPTLISKQQMFARIVGALGGRAAEVRGQGGCACGVVRGWPGGDVVSWMRHCTLLLQLQCNCMCNRISRGVLR